jgi:hypothetical protein
MFRAFGNVGAAVVLMSTFVPWYDFNVALPTPGTQFDVPVSLWSLYPGAAGLLTAAAVAVLLVANVPSLSARRAAGVAAALLGLAVTVYAAARILDIPGLAIFQVPRPAGADALEAGTQLDGGPFLSLLGGFMLTLGSLPVILPAAIESGSYSDQRRVAAA